MKKSFWILIITGIGIFSIGVPVFSAPSIGYNLMFDLPAVRDNGLVPLAFKGFGGMLGFSAEYQRPSWDGGLEADIGGGFLNDRLGNGATLERLWARAYVNRDLVDNYSVGKIALGIPMNFRMNDCYFKSWDDAHIYWQTAHWTGIDITYRRDIPSQWRLKGSIDIPIVALVGRPPRYRLDKQDSTTYVRFWLTRPNHDLRAVLIDKFNGADVSIGAEYPLRRSDIGLKLSYSYAYCALNSSAYASSFALTFTQKWRVAK